MAFEHSHDADVSFALSPTSSNNHNTTTTAANKSNPSNPAISQSYEYMPLGALSGDVMTTRSPPITHRKTCADPRLLHTGVTLWPYSNQQQQQQQQQQQPHQQQQHHGHHSHHDGFLSDGSRSAASAYTTSTSMPYQTHYPDAVAFDASPNAWPAENGIHMSHAMFGSAATPVDANTGDALTPPDSDGVSSPDGTDRRPVKEEDGRRHHPYSRPQKQRTGSAVRSNSPHMRPDGYKKKNAKFDIPADRDLMNIDSLMEKAKALGDEGELKILKTQKRLLRNREAALHSRQKKKDYTAALEVRNKQLEAELKRAKDGRDSFAQQVAFMTSQAQQAKSHAIHAENERNLLETKVAMLEQSLCHTSTSMSNVSSSTGFTNAPDASEWSRGLVNEYGDVGSSSQSSAEATLMLLMAGAANALPSPHRLHSKHLPDHVRAAAPTILNAIFQRAGELGPNFGQPAHLPAAVDDCSAQALDQLVQPEPVTKFRELMTLATHSSS